MSTGPFIKSNTGSGTTGTGRLAPLHDVVTVLVTTSCAACHEIFPIDAVVDQYVCPKCGAALALPPERWRDVLEPLLSRIESLPPDGKLNRTTGSFQFAAHRPAACAQCGVAMPAEVLEQALAGKAFCPACGYEMISRALPSELTKMLPGVTHVIGENPDAVARPQYMRPPVGKGFLLRIDRALRNAYFPPDWGECLAAVGDADNGVYVLVTETARFGQLKVLGLDHELRTRWSRANLPMGKHQDLGITVSGDAVIAWTGDRVSAVKLAVGDGRELARLGGTEPPTAARHFMDLRGAQSMVADLDGSFLLMKERRLVRCAADGQGIATWPPRRGLFGKKHEKLWAFSADDPAAAAAPMVDKLPDYTTHVYRARVTLGWDQRFYLSSGPHIACVERDGKVRWRASLPAGWYVDWGVDEAGNVYVLSGKELPGIWKIGADGKSGTLIVDGRSHNNPLAETAMIVRKDGTLLTFAERGQVRMFSSTGLLFWRTNSAQIADEARVAKQTLLHYGTPTSDDV